MVLVRVDADSVSLQVAHVFQSKIVVNLPERFVIVLEEAVFYHLGLILVLDVSHDLRGVAHTERLGFFEGVDEEEFELLVAAHILVVVGPIGVVLVVED